MSRQNHLQKQRKKSTTSTIAAAAAAVARDTLTSEHIYRFPHQHVLSRARSSSCTHKKMSHFEHRVMMALKHLSAACPTPPLRPLHHSVCTHSHSLEKWIGKRARDLFSTDFSFPHFRLILEMTLNTTAYTYQMQITSLNPSTKVCVSPSLCLF